MGNPIDGYEDEAMLVCPYSGEQLKVVRNPVLGAWTCEGGFDPSQSFPTKKVAESALRTRKGVPNATTVLRCPYTGAPLHIYERGGRFRVGGRFFTPRTNFESKQALLYEVSTRSGKPPKFPRETKLEIVGEAEQHSNPALGLGESSAVVSERIGQVMEEVK